MFDRECPNFSYYCCPHPLADRLIGVSMVLFPSAPALSPSSPVPLFSLGISFIVALVYFSFVPCVCPPLPPPITPPLCSPPFFYRSLTTKRLDPSAWLETSMLALVISPRLLFFLAHLKTPMSPLQVVPRCFYAPQLALLF